MDWLRNLLKFQFRFNKYFLIFTFVLFLLATGSTYAYYAFRYENDSVITGNVIAIKAELDVERVVGTNTKMVPLDGDALSNALKGTGSSNGACIDNVGNLSCQVYKITLTNLGSRIQHVNGTIELYPKAGSGNAYFNLKWRELSNTTTIKSGSAINGMSKSTLVSDLTLESKQEKVWYVAVWLDEVDYDQYDIDKGIFEGTVTFDVGGAAGGASGSGGGEDDSSGSGDSLDDVVQEVVLFEASGIQGMTTTLDVAGNGFVRVTSNPLTKEELLGAKFYFTSEAGTGTPFELKESNFVNGYFSVGFLAAFIFFEDGAVDGAKTGIYVNKTLLVSGSPVTAIKIVK